MDYRAVFMPIVGVSGRPLLALEALLRIGDHPSQHIAYIERAEQSGDIYQADIWMLNAASAVLRQLKAGMVSVNVSPVTLEKSIDRYLLAIELNGDVVPRLIFELTEGVPIFDVGKVLRFVEKVKEFGGKIAMDDFGDGYASLDLLPELEPSYLKLSKGFLDAAMADPSMVVMLRNLLPKGCELIAEQIDSLTKLSFLRQVGIEFAQGYLIGKPHALDLGCHV